jgi:hypothetical protein
MRSSPASAMTSTRCQLCSAQACLITSPGRPSTLGRSRGRASHRSSCAEARTGIGRFLFRRCGRQAWRTLRDSPSEYRGMKRAVVPIACSGKLGPTGSPATELRLTRKDRPQAASPGHASGEPSVSQSDRTESPSGSSGRARASRASSTDVPPVLLAAVPRAEPRRRSLPPRASRRSG